jgi:hypothetical protein
MPTFTVGREASAVLIGMDGVTRLDLPLSTTIKTKPNYDKPKITPLNAPPQQRYLPAGHDVSIDFSRADGSVETYFSQLESAYWAGNTLPGSGNGASLYVYITNPDQSTTTRNYQGLALSFDDAGTFDGPKEVKQSISGFASQCVVS